jgi:DNA ligase-1
LEAYDSSALEFKYDGARVCIHKKGSKIWVFTRRLENVTEQFPELREMVMKAVRPGTCILEG